nr:MAG TPA: hypothetical protein [Caudoviricetes sp.]
MVNAKKGVCVAYAFFVSFRELYVDGTFVSY